MKNIINLARHNLKLFFNSPSSVMLLIAPVFATALLIMMLKGSSYSKAMGIGVVVPKTDIGTGAFFEIMRKDLSIEVIDEETALTKLSQKKVSGIVIIRTNDFVKAVKEGKEDIEVIGINKDPSINFITSELDKALGTVRHLSFLSGGDERKFQLLYEAYQEELRDIPIDNLEFEKTKSVMIFGMFVMVFLFTSIKGLQALMQEKENKISERILRAPVKRYEYILGHILGAYTVLLLQIILQGVVMSSLKLTFGLNFLSFIGICMVLGVVGIALGLIVLALAKNSQGYFILGSFIISPLCMLSDCLFPKEFLPEFINKLALLSPIRWVMVLYKTVMAGGSFFEVLTSLFIALGLSVVLILAGIIIENSKKPA